MSIIVPVYNVEAYLRRCLDSIIAQTIPDWECICVDDGSPDGCGAILDEYAARDARFVVIHKENGGVSTARNAGLDVARGEYIGFVDPDDWIESDTYELALKAARENDADLVQWDMYTRRNKLAVAMPSGKFDVLASPLYFRGTMCTKLVLRKLICSNRLRFPEDIRIAEDRLFSNMCCLLAQCAFHIDVPLYHYEDNVQSALHSYTVEKFWKQVEPVKRMERFTLEFLDANNRSNVSTYNAGNGGGAYSYSCRLA